MTGRRMRHEAGLAAEDAAARAYLARGGAELGRRVRTQAGEIDLIVAEGAAVVFVEVKARASHASGREAVSPRQQARIAAAAELWLAESGRSALTECRFDVVTVDATGAAEIVENAFAAPF